MSDLDHHIDQWVEEGIITPDTGARLHTFEAEHEVAPAGIPPEAPSPRGRSRAVALVGEILGYLGAILAVTAIGFILGQAWTDLPTAGRIAIVSGLAAVVTVAGVLAARVAQPPAQRLASVLLVATVGLLGWLAWVVAYDGVGLRSDDATLWVTVTLAVAATAVYAMRRRALAQLALLVSLAALVPAVLERTDTPFEVWAGVAWGVLGIGWVALALLRRIEPPGVGLVGGGLIAVYGLQTASFEGSRGWMLTAVVAVSVALLALAVTREHASLLMVPGGIGLLVAVPQLVDHVLDDDLATWLGVLVTGVVLVGLAVWMVRDRTQTRT